MLETIGPNAQLTGNADDVEQCRYPVVYVRTGWLAEPKYGAYQSLEGAYCTPKPGRKRCLLQFSKYSFGAACTHGERLIAYYWDNCQFNPALPDIAKEGPTPYTLLREGIAPEPEAEDYRLEGVGVGLPLNGAMRISYDCPIVSRLAYTGIFFHPTNNRPLTREQTAKLFGFPQWVEYVSTRINPAALAWLSEQATAVYERTHRKAWEYHVTASRWGEGFKLHSKYVDNDTEYKECRLDQYKPPITRIRAPRDWSKRTVRCIRMRPTVTLARTG